MHLLVGLGNPESQYAGNRHNTGFMAMDALADRWRIGPFRRRFEGQAAEGEVPTDRGGERVLLLKPQTFYNDSGRAVSQACRFYKLPPADVVVFYDEIDLAPGRFRMKTGGGAAGNNGVRSIAAAIGPEFRRARIGVGHPGHKDLVMRHVLSDFHRAERPWVETLLGALADALPILLERRDEAYQTEVMRLAPAEKLDPRAHAR